MSTDEIISSSVGYMLDNYGLKNSAVLLVASKAYLVYPGYGDFNVTYGSEYFVGVTAGIMYDTSTGGFYFYAGGGLATPGVSYTLTAAPTKRQHVTTGWNFGAQVSNIVASNAGMSLEENNSYFFEAGVGTMGASAMYYYVFDPFYITGDQDAQYAIVEKLATYLQ